MRVNGGFGVRHARCVGWVCGGGGVVRKVFICCPTGLGALRERLVFSVAGAQVVTVPDACSSEWVFDAFGCVPWVGWPGGGMFGSV